MQMNRYRYNRFRAENAISLHFKLIRFSRSFRGFNDRLMERCPYCPINHTCQNVEYCMCSIFYSKKALLDHLKELHPDSFAYREALKCYRRTKSSKKHD